jgi:hypothetical protein
MLFQVCSSSSSFLLFFSFIYLFFCSSGHGRHTWLGKAVLKTKKNLQMAKSSRGIWVLLLFTYFHSILIWVLMLNKVAHACCSFVTLSPVSLLSLPVTIYGPPPPPPPPRPAQTTLTSKTIALDIESSDLITNVCDQYSDQGGLACPDQLRLPVFADNQLDENQPPHKSNSWHRQIGLLLYTDSSASSCTGSCNWTLLTRIHFVLVSVLCWSSPLVVLIYKNEN